MTKVGSWLDRGINRLIGGPDGIPPPPRSGGGESVRSLESADWGPRSGGGVPGGVGGPGSGPTGFGGGGGGGIPPPVPRGDPVPPVGPGHRRSASVGVMALVRTMCFCEFGHCVRL